MYCTKSKRPKNNCIGELKMKKEKIKVQDHEDYVRDSSTNAIINTDIKSYKQYMTKINAQKQTKEDIRDLQNEMSEIKELLIKILEKK